MRVLITGSGGQLGRDCAELLAEAHTVLGLPSARLDITSRDQVRTVLQDFRPETLINCAAYTAVDRCESEQERCMAVNGAGPGILAAECALISCRMIHISTDYVFNGRRPVPKPWHEDDPVEPLSAYGRSKLAGEEAVRQRLQDHLIIRTAWLYGLHGPNFLKTMLRLALSDPGRTLRVVDDQHGALTWSRRLAKQITLLLDSEISGTIHATAAGHCSWYEGARCFLEAMQVPFSIQPCDSSEYPTPAHRPRNSILANTRLQKAGLDRMVAWDEDVVRFAQRHRDRLLAEAR
ncbi:MAG TPA: dTDP-4-dehydrorhamnose reductase [Desulfobulbus sp.]|nr:dTDP-4-dehydrorhamnose reductase [Desulfobulbus sp.]